MKANTVININNNYNLTNQVVATTVSILHTAFMFSTGNAQTTWVVEAQPLAVRLD